MVHMDGSTVTVDEIEVTGVPACENFMARMGTQAHDAILFDIGKDSEAFTAPYGPTFYVQHI